MNSGRELVLRAVGALERHGLRVDFASAEGESGESAGRTSPTVAPRGEVTAGPRGGEGPRQGGAVGRVVAAAGRNRLEWMAVTRRMVTPATLGGVVAQLREIDETTGCPALLVVEHVTPPMAERLKDLGRHFADAAGNAWLAGSGMFVWIVGRRPRLRVPRDPTGRAFTKAGVKVLFALFCDPTLASARVRRIAAAAGVALGAVPAILADLRNRGDLVTDGVTRRFLGTKALLDEWATAYARTLRRKTLMRVYQAPAIDDWRIWNLAADGARFGGEPAARLLVGHPNPSVLRLYSDRIPVTLVLERRLKAASLEAREGLVEVRKPFWGPGLATGAPRPDVVAAPLVYADLLAVGDARALAAARVVYEKLLASKVPPGSPARS